MSTDLYLDHLTQIANFYEELKYEVQFEYVPGSVTWHRCWYYAISDEAGYYGVSTIGDDFKEVYYELLREIKKCEKLFTVLPENHKNNSLKGECK